MRPTSIHLTLVALVCLSLLPPGASAQNPGTASPLAVDASGDYLVVTTDSSGAPTTVWIRDEPTEPATAVVASRPGAFMAGSGTLWRFATTTIGLELCNCVDDMTCRGTATGLVDVPKLASVDGFTLLEPLPAPGSSLGELATIEPAAALSAVVGRYVFVDGATYEYACGAAHGYSTASFAVLDLEARAPAELHSAEERVALQAALAPAALAQVRAGGGEPFDGAGVLTRVVPSYTAEGALDVDLQLTFPSDYASSDGLWDSYTRSALVDAPALPAPLAPYAQLPTAVRAYRDAHPELRLAGWTQLDAEPAVAAAQVRLFGSE